MNTLIGLGVAITVIGAISYNLFSRCVGYFSGEIRPRRPESENGSSLPLQTSKPIVVRSAESHTGSSSAHNSPLPKNDSLISRLFSSIGKNNIDPVIPSSSNGCYGWGTRTMNETGDRLTQVYPHLINPRGDGDCGIICLLMILVLSAQNKEDVRTRIADIIQKVRDKGLERSETAHDNFSIKNRGKIFNGLEFMQGLFEKPTTFAYLKEKLNSNQELYNDVMLALRLLAFNLTHKIEKSALETWCNEFDPHLFLKGPKEYIRFANIYLVLKAFGIEKITCGYLGGINQDGELMINYYWGPKGLSQDVPFCIVLNRIHFQLLTKVNPDLS